MAPFLEVVTRCYKRPAMLRRNQAGLQAQTCADWKQTLLVDGIGRGIEWASENLGMYGPMLVGRYIWLLDDDDECICPTLVTELKEIAEAHNPDVIMLKMDHGPLGILPRPVDWGQGVTLGGVGCSAFVVRREVWQAHATAWLPGAYHSDFNFIAAIFASQPLVYWHDRVASRVQRISQGQPERTDDMKVKALNSFVGYDKAGKKHRIEAGQEFELPAGVDWLAKGLVAKVEKEETKKETKK